MKEYPRVVENINKSSPEAIEKLLARVSSPLGSMEILADAYRDFFRKSHMQLFDMIIRHAWLNQQYRFDHQRRKERMNGHVADNTFTHFMRNAVGISQRPMTTGYIFYVIPSYIKDFFPNFSDFNPFTEPEMFKYPYEHVTLDHLLFVARFEKRLELLAEAEKKKMKIGDFYNWANNWVTMYCEDLPKVMGRDGRMHSMFELYFSDALPYIRDFRNDAAKLAKMKKNKKKKHA